jgi:putative tricarboxylic transport membrane protein
MRCRDQVTATVLFIGALVIMWESRKLPPSGTFGPGPAFFPFWLAILMAGLAALLFLQAWRRAPTAEAPRVFPGLRAFLPIGVTLAALAAYILLLEALGFLLATGFLTAFLLKVVEGERWTLSLGVAVANAFGLQLIFRTLLGVSLPKGFLGF